VRRQPRAPYSSPELARLAGISFRQVDYWTRSGLIEPSIAEARGSGSQRRYSEEDLIRCRVIARLLDYGFSLQRVRGLMRYPDHTGTLIAKLANDLYRDERRALRLVSA